MGWRLKTLVVVLAVGVVGAMGAADDEDHTAPASEGPVPTAEPSPGREEAKTPSTAPTQPTSSQTPRASQPQPTPDPTRDPSPGHHPEPVPEPQQATHLVTRVIDGDTVELANGAAVRLVGIDTPEEGDCGYDQATASMVRLVEGEWVRLVRPDEDTDRYGRLLRYVDRGTVDVGLRQIRSGWAIARYDSRDGYGFHPRENRYIAADRSTPVNASVAACLETAPDPAPQPAPSPGDCAAGYDPCIPPYPPDVDCDDVDGPIHVSGSDPHGLDADGNGLACE